MWVRCHVDEKIRKERPSPWKLIDDFHVSWDTDGDTQKVTGKPQPDLPELKSKNCRVLVTQILGIDTRKRLHINVSG